MAEQAAPGRRQPRWLALLAGLALPGLGLAMLGRPRIGLAALVVWLAGIFLAPWAPIAGMVCLVLGWPLAGLAALAAPRRAPLANAALARAVLVRLALFAITRFGVRAYYVEGYVVPQGSMLPTLQLGDHLWVTKFDYRLRGPRRGDVVIFRWPKDPRQTFVKRVIGLPGDRVRVRGGLATVNDRVLATARPTWPCAWDDHRERAAPWTHHDAVCHEEADGGHRWVVATEADAAEPDFPPGGEPFVVPDGQLFMLGDNRDDSYDSREWGPVRLGALVGRVRTVWYSSGPDGPRWGRVGWVIE